MAVLAVLPRRRKALRRGRLGLIALILARSPSPARADESRTDGRQFGLENAAAGNAMPGAMADPAVAALTPGSVLIAQAGGSTEPPAEVVVGFFGSDPGKVSPADEQRLTNLFYKELQEALAKRYQVVDEAAPGVMKVEVALLDAEAATPGGRSVTMVVPPLRLLSAGYALVAGRYPFSGGGVAAAKISDSMTEQLLGGGVDRRAGGGAIQTAAQWQWGDAENAIKAWSALLADAMYAYTSGARKP